MTGNTVNHIRFGHGFITAAAGQHIKVLFDKPDIGEKTFLYPDGFRNFLKFDDPLLQSEADELIDEADRIAEEQKVQQAAEEQKKKEEAVMLASEKKKAARSAKSKKLKSKIAEQK